MYDFVIVDEPVQAVIYERQIGIGAVNDPVGHGIRRKVYSVYLEGSGLTLKRKSIYVFPVDYGCNQ